MVRADLLFPGMRTMCQRRSSLLLNWCDSMAALLIRVALTLGVLVLLSAPVVSFAGSDEALKAYKSGEYQKALEMWMLLAYEGDVDAQYRLGLMFLHGTGIVVSTEEAVYWLSRAAEQGEPRAQYLLGAVYLSGKGLTSDREHGLEWWRAAAGNGNAAAQYGIGTAYLYGAGVSENLEDAEKWLTAALKSGSPAAGLLLENLTELSKSKARSGSDSQYARVGPVAVWIYSAFNRLSVILAEAGTGELVRIIERQNDWYLVELSQSLTGWVDVNDIEQVSGSNVKVAEGAVLRSGIASVQESAPIVMDLGKSRWLKFVDLAEPWAELAVPGPFTGWTPVLGLVEQADDPASLQRIWQNEYRLRSEDSYKDTGIAALADFLRAQDNADAVSTKENAAKLSEVPLEVQSTGQTKGEPAPSESVMTVPLNRNDYQWLLAQAPERYTLELLSSTSEMLIRQFYRAGSFDDRVSYFSSSVSGKRWFTLFLGSYSDLESVQKALSVLPVRLDAMRVRRISSVVQDLCNGLDDVPVSVLEKLRSRCSEQM